MYKKVDINDWDEMKNYPKGSYCFDYKGNLYYFVDGKRHRLDGPSVEEKNGNKWWFQKGELHRLDGPSVEWSDGEKWWYQNGKQHRLDGPAIEGKDGYKEWYLHGREYSYKEWKEKVDNYLVYLWSKYV